MNPTILTSRTKAGAWIFLIATLLHLFLPEFGITLAESLWDKIFYAIEAIGALLGITGLRNAIGNIQKEFYQSPNAVPKQEDFKIKGSDLTSKPYGSKNIQAIILVFTLSVILSGSVMLTGCSSNQVCFSCNDKVLSWQGSVTGFTQGRYIETACFKLDLWKIIQQISADELSWEDLTKLAKIEVVIKDGEFCDPNDKSYYKITLQSDEADSTKKVIYTRKDAIILKDGR